MATTCSDIVARAQAFSPAMNAPLTSDTSVMLSRIRADQSALFSKAAEMNRDFFSVPTTVTSSSGSSGRTVNIATLSPPVERILKLTLPSGTEVNQVDPLDIDGELAPRYLAQGTTLKEVNGEWGASGTVTLTLLYVQAPTDIDPSGTLDQPVSVPDRWTDILVINLAQYLQHIDVGRDPAEAERLQALADARLTDFLNYLAHFGGVESRRFVIPAPTGTKN